MSSGLSDHFSPSGASFLSPITKIVLLFTLMVVCAVFFLWREEQGQRFPAIEEGAYTGSISLPDGSVQPFSIVVGSSPIKLKVLLFADNTKAFNGELVARRSIFGEGAPGFLPLPVMLRNTQYWLGGAENGPHQYEGHLYDGRERAVGDWAIEKRKELNNPEDAARAERWLSLVVQLAASKSEGKELEGQLSTAVNETNRIGNIASATESLTENAKEKLKEERLLLQDAQKENEQVSKRVAQLRRQVDLTQRLSGIGRLVQLSRETLRREEGLFKKQLMPQAQGGSS